MALGRGYIGMQRRVLAQHVKFSAQRRKVHGSDVVDAFCIHPRARVPRVAAMVAAFFVLTTKSSQTQNATTVPRRPRARFTRVAAARAPAMLLMLQPSALQGEPTAGGKARGQLV